MKLKGKKVLVTGGAGFIGSHLVDALLSEGCFVNVLDNLVTGKKDNLRFHKTNKCLRFILGDVTCPRDVAKAINAVDVVFHLACLGVRHSLKHPLLNHRVNAEGVLIVLEQARKSGIKKFIHCSSSEVYGTAEYAPMPETHSLRPSTVYGASKLAGEAYARAYFYTYGLKTVVVRPFNTYGPRSHHEGDAGEAIPRFIVSALNRRPLTIFGDGRQTRDFTYVLDTAAALIEAAMNDGFIGKTLNVGSGKEISIKNIAGSILHSFGCSATMIKNLKPRPGDVRRLCADVSLFMSGCPWRPQVDFEEGLQRTIEWFRCAPSAAKLIRKQKDINWQ